MLFLSSRRIFFRPSDSELDEYHPKASRLLYVGSLPRDTTVPALADKFEPCGEILEIDIKKSAGHALIQFADVSSVARAIRTLDGDALGGGGAKLRLGFGRPVPSKCVWCQGLAEGLSDRALHVEFGRYGKVQDVLVDRSRGHALVYFDQVGK